MERIQRIRKHRRLQPSEKFVPFVPFLVKLAAATGFYDQSHFTKRFRKVTGVTPSEYRKGGVL
jgi:AraC-like DNA-binding protein